MGFDGFVCFLVQVMINGDVVGDLDSSPTTGFTTLAIQSNGVETMILTTVGLTQNERISLFEVSDSHCSLWPWCTF